MEETTKIFRVAIIGAGPSGLMASYFFLSDEYKELMRKVHGNFHITLFEKSSKIKRKVCGEYLSPFGVQILHKYHVNHILHGFEKLFGMILYDVKNQRAIHTHFHNNNDNNNDKEIRQSAQGPYGVSLNRELFDQRILETVLKKNAESSDECFRILFSKNIVKILPKNSTEFRGNSENHQWTIESDEGLEGDFDLVILADGRNSHLGKSLGHYEQTESHRMAIHCYLKKKQQHNVRFGEMHIFPDGSYCGINPISTDEVNFSIVIEQPNRHSRDDLIHQLNQRIDQSKRLKLLFDPIKLDTAALTSEEFRDTKIKTSFPITHKNPIIAKNRIVSVGDASGFIDPMTGEGITQSLISSELLVKSLVQFPDLDRALDHYRKSKVRYFRTKSLLNRSFQKLIQHPQLVSMVSLILSHNQRMSDTLMRIIGNLEKPLPGLCKLILLFFRGLTLTK